MKRCPHGHTMKQITVMNVYKGPRKEWHCEWCWFNRLNAALKRATDPQMRQQLEAALKYARKRYGKSHP